MGTRLLTPRSFAAAVGLCCVVLPVALAAPARAEEPPPPAPAEATAAPAPAPAPSAGAVSAPAEEPRSPLAAAAELSANSWIELGWKAKEEKRWADAIEAFEQARALGADPQRIEQEIGWVEVARKDVVAARKHFLVARDGPDPEQRRAARRALRSIPRPLWADLYADAVGWYRFHPSPPVANLVPTLRLRAYLHPVPKLDIDPYVYLQVSRDVASRAVGPLGYPLIYSDNSLGFGVGILLRALQRHIGLYAQIGPAIQLLPVDGPKVQLDGRVALFAMGETPLCRPVPLLVAPGAKPVLGPCADIYADAVYLPRFSHNIVMMVRGRLSLNYLVTGPVAWAPFVEGRAFKDIDNDFWNNFADAGVGHRWRLLVPIGLDLMLGLHTGRYYGLQNLDPPPALLGFAELRLVAATYVEF
jgi:hypothetical protein